MLLMFVCQTSADLSQMFGHFREMRSCQVVSLLKPEVYKEEHVIDFIL